MKITLDTNVRVSAFISKDGRPAQLLDIILTFPEIELVLSEAIIDEFMRVMIRQDVRARLNYSISEVEELVTSLKRTATFVPVKSNYKIVKEDPKDDVIINTAHDGKADFIVSGDKHLLALKRFKKTKIINPKSMMTIIAQRFGEIIISKRLIEE